MPLPKSIEKAALSSNLFFEKEQELDPAKYLILYLKTASSQFLELIKNDGKPKPDFACKQLLSPDMEWSAEHAKKWIERSYFTINGKDVPEAYKKTKGE